MLPEKWREARVFNDNGTMDENLTLVRLMTPYTLLVLFANSLKAHVTHNTAVIMLHQSIAYPSPKWQNSLLSPVKGSSIETCFAAASEISIIAEKFLLSSKAVLPPQLAFSLFIAARLLLAHSCHHSTDLPTEFNTLTDSLLEISRRWDGDFGHSDECGNLASKFASRLLKARELGPAAIVHQPSLDLRQAVYFPQEEHDIESISAGQSSSSSIHPAEKLLSASSNRVSTQYGEWIQDSERTGDTINSFMLDLQPQVQRPSPEVSLAFPPLPDSFLSNELLTSRSGNEIESTRLGEGNQGNLDGVNVLPIGEDSGHTAASNASQEFDVSSFLGNHFQPVQRISTFSGLGNWIYNDSHETNGNHYR